MRIRKCAGAAPRDSPRCATRALARAIDDLPDLLDHPHTVATYALIAQGATALPAVLPLSQAADPLTRMRAWLVWRSVVSKEPGVSDWNALWQQLGSFAPDAPQPQRNAAVQQWSGWLAKRHP